MSQDVLNWTWVVLLVAMIAVRKMHERKAGRRSTLKGTPLAEAVLMLLWGVAAGMLPFFYIFGTWLDFADLSIDRPSELGLTGVALFLISVWLLHRSHADLGEMRSPTVEPGAKQRLVTDRVYKLVRHPMYAAHVLWGVAQMALRIPREERAMIQQFADEYRRYMDRTGRILPKSYHR